METGKPRAVQYTKGKVERSLTRNQDAQSTYTFQQHMIARMCQIIEFNLSFRQIPAMLSYQKLHLF